MFLKAIDLELVGNEYERAFEVGTHEPFRAWYRNISRREVVAETLLTVPLEGTEMDNGRYRIGAIEAWTDQ